MPMRASDRTGRARRESAGLLNGARDQLLQIAQKTWAAAHSAASALAAHLLAVPLLQEPADLADDADHAHHAVGRLLGGVSAAHVRRLIEALGGVVGAGEGDGTGGLGV